MRYGIRPLDADELGRRAGELSEVLVDCVEDGASVGFLLPLTIDRAGVYWQKIKEAVRRGERILVVAESMAEDGQQSRIDGTAQLILHQPENQPHRADVAKLLVHRRARRLGLGARLIGAVEQAARDHGRTLLVLDTVTGTDADRLYSRLGWVRAGEIPGYALWPDGRPCPATYFYKQL